VNENETRNFCIDLYIHAAPYILSSSITLTTSQMTLQNYRVLLQVTLNSFTHQSPTDTLVIDTS